MFRKLRNGQAVKSVRGPGGGYVLARNMDQITIKDVLDCVGENINPARDIVGTEAEAANSLEFHLSKNYFMNLGIIMKEYLATTTLGDLVRKSKEVEAEVASSQESQASQAGIMTSSMLKLEEELKGKIHGIKVCGAGGGGCFLIAHPNENKAQMDLTTVQTANIYLLDPMPHRMYAFSVRLQKILPLDS